MIKREALIFLVVGTLTVFVDLIVYLGLVSIHFNIELAKGSSFVTGMVFAYFANRLWTFGNKKHVSGSVWRFIVLYSITLAANVWANTFFLRSLNDMMLDVQLAFLLATGLSAFLNFIGMKYFVFKPYSGPEF